MEIVQVNLDNLKKKIIDKCLQAIKDGKIVIVPTDTVYGLICDATNEKAVRKIFEIKNRALSKAIGIFVGDIRMARKYVKIGKKQEKLLKSAATFILPAQKNLPYQGKTLGIRIPHAPLITTIIHLLDVPLAQTSANPSGINLGNNIQTIIRVFRKQAVQPDLVLDAGILPGKKPSRIVDLTGNRPSVLRE